MPLIILGEGPPPAIGVVFGEPSAPDPTDPYGVDLYLHPTSGDLVVGAHGGLAFIQGPENCAQALSLRARTYPGELPLHPDYGSILAATLIGQHTDDDLLAQATATREIRTILENDRRFAQATDLQTRIDPANPNARHVAVRLELAGGEALIVGNLADARVDELDLTGSSADPETIDSLTDDPVDDFAIDLSADDLGDDGLLDLLGT